MPVWTTDEVLGFLARVEPALDQLDHYQLLDVPIDAGPQAIDDAFHRLAAALHPERHGRTLASDQLARLSTVYRRIAEAHRVLTDPLLRDVYLRDMARQAFAAPTQPPKSPRRASVTAPPLDPVEAAELARISPKAQSLYRRALAALRTGDRTSALLNLRMALASHPDSGFLKDALAGLVARK
jgi:curved DNA-binding protein CbpA